MIKVSFDPETLIELIGIPHSRFNIEAIELVDGRFYFYICDIFNDADLIVDIEHPEYEWKSHTKMRLPRGI